MADTQVKFVTFQPGAIGIEHRSGTVTKINEGGQAEREGVKVGDVIKTVGDWECNNFVDKSFLDAQKGSTPYQVMFETKGKQDEPKAPALLIALAATAANESLDNIEKELDILSASSRAKLAAALDAAEFKEYEYDLRVQILSATDLTNPEYRLGDKTMGWVNGEDALISSPYVEVSLDDRHANSVPTNDVKKGNAKFADAQVLMLYKEDQWAVIRLLDKRRWQALVRGDPVIGQATLPLPSELKDCKVRSITLSIQRGQETTGQLQLQYQLLKAKEKTAFSDVLFYDFREPSFEECVKSLPDLPEDQQRAVKGLLGTAIGDAVGLPFELGSHVKNRKRLDSIACWKGTQNMSDEAKARIQEFVKFVFFERMSRAEGTPFGRTYSDDTVCTDLKMQAIASVWKHLEGLKHDQGTSASNGVDDMKRQLFEELMSQFLVWAHCADGNLFQGYGGFTKDLLRPKGNQLAELSTKLESQGKHLWNASPASSKIIPSPEYLEFAATHFGGKTCKSGSWGNGAVMSFTPGVILSRSSAGTFAHAAPELAMSHRHPTAMAGAALLQELLDQIHAGKVPNCRALPQGVLHCPSWTTVVLPLAEDPSNYMYPISAFSDFLSCRDVDKQLAASLDFLQRLDSHWSVSGDHRFGPLGEALRIAANGDDLRCERLAVRDDPSELVRFSQRGLNSVFIAIWCAIGAKNCWDWLEKVLYIGGDADTIGAVAGQIACPLMDTIDVIETFKTFVALDNCVLASIHAAAHPAARRYLYRATLFASGQWSEMLDVPRLVDPYFEGITEKSGVQLLGRVEEIAKPERRGSDEAKKPHNTSWQRVQCRYGVKCHDRGERHRQQFAHQGDPDFMLGVRTRCRHGAKCYNWDKIHRATYSHPGDSDF